MVSAEWPAARKDGAVPGGERVTHEKTIGSASKTSGAGPRIRWARIANYAPHISESYPKNAPFLIDTPAIRNRRNSMETNDGYTF